jgi:uncharacterized protein involved in exopolysaccharide biosynthesis
MTPSGAASDALRPYAAAMRRRIRLVVALPAVLSVGTVSVLLLMPRTYVARAAFVASEPASLSSSLGALSSVASQLGVPGLSTLAGASASGSPQFYADLLTSNTVLHAVVTARYDARKGEENGGRPFSGTLVEYLKARGTTSTDSVTDAMKRFQKSTLEVTPDRPTGIVRFAVRTKNRELSALIARRLLDLVNDFNLRRRQTQAGAERDFTAVRAAAALDSLRAAEAALADFRATNIDFSHSPALATREAQLQRRLTLLQQIYTSVAQRYELASIEAVRNTPVVTVLDAPEGLVMARPRYVAAFGIGTAFAGLLVACVIALAAERSPDPR